MVRLRIGKSARIRSMLSLMSIQSCLSFQILAQSVAQIFAASKGDHRHEIANGEQAHGLQV